MRRALLFLSVLLIVGGSTLWVLKRAAVKEWLPHRVSMVLNRDTLKLESELLREIMAVTYMREPKQREDDFANWLDTLNQGASLEGIYNGLSHSFRMRELERLYPQNSPKALSFFLREMVRIRKVLVDPTELDAESAQPLMRLGMDKLRVEEGFEEGEGGSGVEAELPEQPEVQTLSFDNSTPQEGDENTNRLRSLFRNASIYTLKRVLADEALRLLHQMEPDREALADWYADWVVELLKDQVLYGHPRRNVSNRDSHRQWAAEAPFDLIQWEVLNRLHRSLNTYYRKDVNP